MKERSNMKKTWYKPTITQLDVSKTAAPNHNKTPSNKETHGSGSVKYKNATHVS